MNGSGITTTHPTNPTISTVDLYFCVRVGSISLTTTLPTVPLRHLSVTILSSAGPQVDVGRHVSLRSKEWSNVESQK